MAVAALISWTLTVFAGLYLLAIWLIEYDVSAPGGAYGLLPRTVITGHVLLATAGLVAWMFYLIQDKRSLAWTALCALLAVALLGFTMLGRWLLVRRAIGAALSGGPTDRPGTARAAIPAQSSLPVPVVVSHGLLASTTVFLVLLTVLGLGGS